MSEDSENYPPTPETDEEPKHEDAPPRRGELGRHRGRRGSILRQNESRTDYLQHLLAKKKIQNDFLHKSVADFVTLSAMEAAEVCAASVDGPMVDSQTYDELKGEVEAETGGLSSKVREIHEMIAATGVKISKDMTQFPLEVRMENVNYSVPVDDNADAQIQTVYTSSFLFPIVECCKRLLRGEKVLGEEAPRKKILSDINMDFRPGRSYLVLGPPGSGKTTLLKAISGLLRPSKDHVIEGTVSYNGKTLAVSILRLETVDLTTLASSPLLAGGESAVHRERLRVHRPTRQTCTALHGTRNVSVCSELQRRTQILLGARSGRRASQESKRRETAVESRSQRPRTVRSQRYLRR